MTQQNEAVGIKTKGKVLRTLGDYGFLSNEETPGRNISSKPSGFVGTLRSRKVI